MFFLPQAVPATFSALLAPDFDAKDANCARVTAEAAFLVHTLNTLRPDVAGRFAEVLPRFFAPGVALQEFIHVCTSAGTMADTQRALNSLLASR